jgi:hypothetical protein
LVSWSLSYTKQLGLRLDLIFVRLKSITSSTEFLFFYLLKKLIMTILPSIRVRFWLLSLRHFFRVCEADTHLSFLKLVCLFKIVILSALSLMTFRIGHSTLNILLRYSHISHIGSSLSKFISLHFFRGGIPHSISVFIP